ncbi:hypothetical protein IV102_25930 [bacterium]|nr:hypothetical protein [bacterium]
MSASRKLRRQQLRDAAKNNSPTPSSPAHSPLSPGLTRLRRRVRYVLLFTTLIGLVLLRVFHDPVAQALLQYGMPARVALVLALLSPALFTWMIGLGQLRDSADLG